MGKMWTEISFPLPIHAGITHVRNAAGGRCFADGDRVQLLATREHVDDGILDERAEHEHQTGGHPDVDRLGERNRRKASLPGALGGDRQHGEYAERDSRRHRLEVDPEGHPRQQNDQHARQVRGKDVGAQTALQVEIGSDARVWTCNITTCTGGSSGVTRIGDTRGGKLMVSPYFFLEKPTTFF